MSARLNWGSTFRALLVRSPRNCSAHKTAYATAATGEAASSAQSLLVQRHTQFHDERSQTQLSNLATVSSMSQHSTPIGQIQFEEADPHTPVNSQRRLVTPPPVSSKVQRSGLVHIIGKDPPKIPNLFGDFATIVPDDSQEQ